MRTRLVHIMIINNGVTDMKAIINGLRYNTENAILIGKASYNGSRTDFQWWAAGLYRTPRSGRFFLAGSGGPMTRWGHRGCQQNETIGSSGIILLDHEDALEWAERYLTHDEIEAGFAKHLTDA